MGHILPCSEEDDKLYRSLYIKHDDKYCKMDWYRRNQGTNSKTGHFSRMLNRAPVAKQADTGDSDETSPESENTSHLISRENEVSEMLGFRCARPAIGNVTSRVE